MKFNIHSSALQVHLWTPGKLGSRRMQETIHDLKSYIFSEIWYINNYRLVIFYFVILILPSI